jgi:hypothetical protein
MCGYVPLDGAAPVPPVALPSKKKASGKAKLVEAEAEEGDEDGDEEEKEVMSLYAKKRYRELSAPVSHRSASSALAATGDDQSVTDILSKVTSSLTPPGSSFSSHSSQKLCWVAQELEREESLDRSLQLAVLLKALAEGKIAMKGLVSETQSNR